MTNYDINSAFRDIASVFKLNIDSYTTSIDKCEETVNGIMYHLIGDLHSLHQKLKEKLPLKQNPNLPTKKIAVKLYTVVYNDDSVSPHNFDMNEILSCLDHVLSDHEIYSTSETVLIWSYAKTLSEML